MQQTMNYVNVKDIIEKYGDSILYTYQNENKGVFGRFESVRQVNTQYTYIIDDDIIPGPKFLENVQEACSRLNAIISPNGRIISKYTNRINSYIGDGDEFQHSFAAIDTEVDFGNNSWFFKTEWTRFFLSIPPYSRNNGEDIHLSAICKLLGNIPTYVVKQTIPYESGNTKRIYSLDEYSLHKRIGFQAERAGFIAAFRKQGWMLMQEKD